jgi:hypothetical protein
LFSFLYMGKVTEKQAVALDAAKDNVVREKLRELFKRQRAIQLAAKAQPTKVLALRDTPKPKAKGKGVPRKLRGTHFWSSRHLGLVPTGTFEGSALGVTGRWRETISLGTTDRRLYLFTNVGHAGSVGGVFHDNGTTIARGVFHIPTMNSTAIAGGPMSGRAMKLSVHLNNPTAGMRRGGEVYVLVSRQRILLDASPSTMTRANLSTAIDSILDHPDILPLTAEDFAHGRTFYSLPCDMPAYHSYKQWDGSLGFDEMMAHSCLWTGETQTDRDRSMYTIAIVLAAPAESQVWAVSARAGFYTRWGLSTIPGQLMRPVPTAPQPILNQHLSVAEAAMRVGEVGVATGAALSAAVYGAARFAGRAAAAAEAVGPMVGELEPFLL